MNGFFQEIVPIVLIFLAGYLLKVFRVLKLSDGDILLKVVFYFSLPALILNSLPSTEITREFAWLPLLPPATMLILFLLARLMISRLKLPRKKEGVFVVGLMILNIGFTLPFVIAAFGTEGLSRILIMDLGNGIMVFSFVYYQACRYGSGKESGAGKFPFRFLKVPPVWAIVAGLLLNFFNVPVTGMASRFFSLSGDLTIPLLMLSVGIFFEPGFQNVRELVLLVFIRMGLGFLLGLLTVEAFSLEGLTRAVVLLGLSTPIGYNTLTFASIEKLDGEFAANAVSMSILAGIVWYPVLIWFIV